jgi:hypothetical protein
MPAKRNILGRLTRDELVATVDRHEIAIGDHRVREQPAEAAA